MDKLVVENNPLLLSALAGLQAVPKTMEAKWLYDTAGSELFEEITKLPEYYPTRTELSILKQHAPILALYAPDGAALIELGSGASVKTRTLLDSMSNLKAYVPIDISVDLWQFLQGNLARITRT